MQITICKTSIPNKLIGKVHKYGNMEAKATGQ